MSREEVVARVLKYRSRGVGTAERRRRKASCTCSACIGACKTRPGRMMPGDADRIARVVGVPLEDLFVGTLCVEYLFSGFINEESLRRGDFGEPTFVLAPTTVEGNAGLETPFIAGGRCVFLDADERCAIHPVRPFECREAWCGISEAAGDVVLDRIRAKWREPSAAAQIAHLLGRSPSATPPTESEQRTIAIRCAMGLSLRP